MGRLKGKIAIITGAARGTGEITARRFVEEGATVVLADILDEPGRVVAKELGDPASYETLDVTSEDDWQRVVQSTVDRLGRVDVLVNNAAVLLMRALEETSLQEFERVVSVNQTGTFLGIRAVIETMKAAGGGSIVNVSSVDGMGAKNGIAAYASSKWAVRGLTRVAALELGRFCIRVNTVCPEAGSAHMIAPYVPEGVDMEKALGSQQPVLAYQRDRTINDRICDVANMIVFLASDEAASCTGADFTVDGGNMAGKLIRGIPGS
jgi:3alpha(or 20beta)-hydroxysteroid dehydrogenase